MFKHTATHDGYTFTRTSQNRVYTHCIVRVCDVAQERANAQKSALKYYEVNRSYMAFVAAQQPGVEATYQTETNRPWTHTWGADEIAKATQWMTKGLEGLVTEYLADFDGRTAGRRLNKTGTHFYVGGDEWCGRQDLADAAIGKWFKLGVKAVAVPAVVVKHTPKPRKAK